MSHRPLIAHRYPTAIVWRRTRETFDLELRQKAPQSLWCINKDWRLSPPFPFHALCTCTRHYTPCLCSVEVRVAGRTRRPSVTFSLCACEFQPTCAFPQNVNGAVTCGELANGQAKRGMGKQTNKQKKTVYRDLRAPQREEADDAKLPTSIERSRASRRIAGLSSWNRSGLPTWICICKWACRSGASHGFDKCGGWESGCGRVGRLRIAHLRAAR